MMLPTCILYLERYKKSFNEIRNIITMFLFCTAGSYAPKFLGFNLNPLI